ncbi:MAG: hypothetical protein AAGJ81_12250 [Verrucomicrobiota bacterium]
MGEKIKIWFESIQATDFSYLSEGIYAKLGLIALGLFIILIVLRLRPVRKIRAFKGETGPVEISRHALLELVLSACEQLPEVRKPSIKIRAKRRLNLLVRIKVDGASHLRDTAAFLQSHLKDALENNLGVERLGKIRVLVTGIKKGNGKRREVDLNKAPSAEPKVEKPGKEEVTSSKPEIPPAPKPDLNPPAQKKIDPADKPASKTETPSVTERVADAKPSEKKI